MTDLLTRLLDGLPNRLAHTLAVGARAAEVHALLTSGEDRGWVGAAALHDIGYAPTLRDTGLHQIDGARYLRSIGYHPSLVSLVAHHSCATFEAHASGYGDSLVTEFPPPAGPWADTLELVTYCDMTTSPTGQSITVDERLGDIFDRYTPGTVVAESMTLAEPSIRDVVSRVSQRLAAAQGS